MTSAMGIGAVLGGLFVAAKGKTGLRPLVAASAAFGVLLLAAGFAPNLGLELLALALAGGASISFMATGNSTLQLRADPSMRGRVMALWFVAILSSTPLGRFSSWTPNRRRSEQRGHCRALAEGRRAGAGAPAGAHQLAHQGVDRAFQLVDGCRVHLPYAHRPVHPGVDLAVAASVAPVQLGNQAAALLA